MGFTVWESGVSWGCAVAFGSWGIALALVAVGWFMDEPSAGQVGIWFCGVAASLTIIRDNRKTRHAVRAAAAPPVVEGPVRSVR